mmetsp:Transcript_34355/g.90063  ORF Transcript_34355/g.90063 Transcript_34355/m.90063 type:complete len:321 (-) Transcript_34355:298-1260(-)
MSRTLKRNGVMGSRWDATSICILLSRIIKFVAHVSSSMRRQLAPASIASIVLAACEVEPEASSVEKSTVSLPRGRFWMKLLMSVPAIDRPSSARIAIDVGAATTNSRPSPGMWSYTPTLRASSSVDLPWNPPPTISDTPGPIPIPTTLPPFLSGSSTLSDAGDSKGTARSAGSGSSDAPDRRGRTAPSRTNATSLFSARASRRWCWSSHEVQCSFSAAASCRSCQSVSRAIRGKWVARMSYAHSPMTLRPWAGRPTVKRTSIPSTLPSAPRSSMQHVRSRMCCPGVSNSTSPPLAPCQLPPPAFWSKRFPTTVFENARAR